MGVLASASNAQTIPAFPGADGAGADTTGGRGGVVYHVTRLDGETDGDRSVDGTLAYGLNNANFTTGGVVRPRTIVFDVGGTIWLGRKGENVGWDTQGPLSAGSHITIAGQTAPGGINIAGGGLRVNGDDAMIRNLVIAPGYGARKINPTTGFADQYTYDGMNLSAKNVVIDHVSAVFATDETISVDERANHVTVEYCNISQGQNYPQSDAEARSVVYTGHALGSLIQPGQEAKISFHHNLYAHQKGRLPRVGSEKPDDWDAKNPGVPFIGSFNDFRNNVFYNWLGTAGTGARAQPSSNNFVGNFYLAGPGGENPAGGADFTIATTPGGTSIFNGSNGPTGVFHSGNRKDTNKDGDADDSVPLTDSDFPSSSFQGSAYTQVPYVGVTDAAGDAYERVLKYVGAGWDNRNTIDARLIGEVRRGSGRITALNDPAHGTEWNALLGLRPKGGVAPFRRPANFDTDRDGMPDTWETAHGLNPNVADNNGDFDADGYTNLEEYINELAEWPAPRAVTWSGGDGRYELINNWDIHWQPSRHDEAQIHSGTATIDSPGQHARMLKLAANSGDAATLAVKDGWIHIEQDLIVGPIGSGRVRQTGGALHAGRSVVLGGTSGAAGAYDLSGGSLRTPRLTRGASGGTFQFDGGALHADDVTFDLLNRGGTLAPGDGIGHTHVAGNLTLQGGSVAIELASDARFDTVAVDGRLELGGTLDITLLGDYRPGDDVRWPIMKAGNITGGFTKITQGFRVETTGGNLYLAPLAAAPVVPRP